MQDETLSNARGKVCHLIGGRDGKGGETTVGGWRGGAVLSVWIDDSCAAGKRGIWPIVQKAEVCKDVKA